MGFIISASVSPNHAVAASASKLASTCEPPAEVPNTIESVDEVQVEAWGDGADWLVARADGLVGAHDDPSAFRPAEPRLAELARRFAAAEEAAATEEAAAPEVEA